MLLLVGKIWLKFGNPGFKSSLKMRPAVDIIKNKNDQVLLVKVDVTELGRFLQLNILLVVFCDKIIKSDFFKKLSIYLFLLGDINTNTADMCIWT